MPEVSFDVNLKQRAYLVALDVELADKLTAIARAHHTSSEELVNIWVREKIFEIVA